MRYQIGQEYTSPNGQCTVKILAFTPWGILVRDLKSSIQHQVNWDSLAGTLGTFHLSNQLRPGQIWNHQVTGDAFHIASVSKPQVLIRYWDQAARMYRVGKKLPCDCVLTVAPRSPGLFDTFEHRVSGKEFEVHEMVGDRITLLDANSGVRYRFDNDDGQIYRELQFKRAGLLPHIPINGVFTLAGDDSPFLRISAQTFKNLTNSIGNYFTGFESATSLGQMPKVGDFYCRFSDIVRVQKVEGGVITGGGGNLRGQWDVGTFLHEFTLHLWPFSKGFNLTAPIGRLIRGKSAGSIILDFADDPVTLPVPSLFPQVGDTYVCKTSGLSFEVKEVNQGLIFLQGFTDTQCRIENFLKGYRYSHSKRGA